MPGSWGSEPFRYLLTDARPAGIGGRAAASAQNDNRRGGAGGCTSFAVGRDGLRTVVFALLSRGPLDLSLLFGSRPLWDRLAGHNHVLQDADALDLDGHPVAGIEGTYPLRGAREQ